MIRRSKFGYIPNKLFSHLLLLAELIFLNTIINISHYYTKIIKDYYDLKCIGNFFKEILEFGKQS